MNIIACISDANNGIGSRNKLLYDIPDDKRKFRDLTHGQTVIMGRETLVSLDYHSLPNRRNIVISDKYSGEHGGKLFVPSLDDAIAAVPADEVSWSVWVIGGQSIYEEAIQHPECQTLYLTRVNDEGRPPEEADRFFPAIPPSFHLRSRSREFLSNFCYHPYQFEIWSKS